MEYLALTDDQINERLDEITRSIVDYSRTIETLIARLAGADGQPAERYVWREEHRRLGNRRDNLYHESWVLRGELRRRAAQRRRENSESCAVCGGTENAHALGRVLSLLNKLKNNRIRADEVARGLAEKQLKLEHVRRRQETVGQGGIKAEYKRNIHFQTLCGEVAVLHESMRERYLRFAETVPPELRDEFNANCGEGRPTARPSAEIKR